MFISGVNNSEDIVRLDLVFIYNALKSAMSRAKTFFMEINNLQDYPAYNLQEFNFNKSR